MIYINNNMGGNTFSLPFFENIKALWDYSDFEQDPKIKDLCEICGVDYIELSNGFQALINKEYSAKKFVDNEYEQLFRKYYDINNDQYKIQLQIMHTLEKTISMYNSVVLKKKEILSYKGIKGHGLDVMNPETKLKHVRTCWNCRHQMNFDIVTDQEILTGVIDTSEHLHDLSELENTKNKIKMIEDIKNSLDMLKQYIYDTYLRYKININEKDNKNKNIDICIHIDDYIIEVPMNKIVDIAIEEYAKIQFNKDKKIDNSI